ncbi:Formation of crista junctions protein 1 [Actinomortierella ambigua]|uniref:MICOS complex subunit MIC60 n=1 Tax=Actinomortierella ambigua TaxID=1343610 RepID=A0A9P6U2H8_9FUNG|nr:Formation of crista junctions protein 1 [Actinomortierella ambigua]
MLSMHRLALAGSSRASLVRSTGQHRVAQRFMSANAGQKLTQAEAQTLPKKKGMRLRTKAFLTLTVLGAGTAGVVYQSMINNDFRDLLENNVPYYAHSLERLEALKDNEDLDKVLKVAHQASGKAVELGKDAYRQASDLINGTTTPAPEKKKEEQSLASSVTEAAAKLTKKIEALDQPSPAKPAARADYVPSETPAPVYLAGAAAGSTPSSSASTPATIEAKKPKAEKKADEPPKPAQPAAKKGEKKDEKKVEEKKVEEKKVEEKKEEVVAAVPKPEVKKVTLVKVETQEPILSNLNATLHQLVAILNETGIPEQGHEIFEKANADLQAMHERLEALKAEGEAQALTVMNDLTERYTKLAGQKDSDHELHLSQVKETLHQEHEKAQKLAIEQELAHQKEALEEQQRQAMIQYAVEMQRRWVREVKVRVENERGGRLARLDHINLRLKMLERQGLVTGEFLEHSARTHQLWCSAKALEKAYEAGERRPFDRELARLKRLAEQDKENELLRAVLASIPEAVAREGVDSVPELADRFQHVADEVRKASLVPDNGGVLAHGMSVVLSKLMFKKQGLVPGNDVEAILARTEFYLQESDLEQAVRELNQLQGWGKRLAKDWIVAARRRVEVGQALDIISTQANLTSLTLA